MISTTLRELFEKGLLSKEELSAMKNKLTKNSSSLRRRKLRTPPGQIKIPIADLSSYIEIAKRGNMCICPQTQLAFGTDRREPVRTRPVLIINAKRGPFALVAPLTTKTQTTKDFLIISQHDFSCLQEHSRYKKDGRASPIFETVPIRSLEYYGQLSPNKLEEVNHWLDQLENTNDDQQTGK